MWKAILKKEINGTVSITYTEYDITGTTPTGKTEKNFQDVGPVTNLAFFQDQVNSKINYLNGRNVNLTALLDGSVLPVATPIIIPPAQTQPEIDYANFAKWMALVNTLAFAKQLGWITGNEQIVLDVKTKVLALATVNIPKLFI